VKLLRVLQERAFTRVGDTRLVRADFRLIAATNRDLAALVRGGSFREDLYYRLEVVPVIVPPLRQRLDDLEELVKYFAARVAVAEGMPIPGISAGFIERLKAHSWPGNVRELENLVERFMVVYRPQTLELHHLEEEDPLRFSTAAGDAPDTRGGSEAFETGSRPDRDAITEALRQCGGNRTKAAARLGISRRTLYYRMEQFGIE